MARASARLALVLLVVWAAPSHGALTDWISGGAPVLGPEDADAKEQYLARHEVYPVDVRPYDFYQRVIGLPGESRSEDWQVAHNLTACGVLPESTDAQLSFTKDGSWWV